MNVHECEQGSDEWVKLRLGIPTASQFHNIITPTGMPAKGDRRATYKYKLIAERLLGQQMDSAGAGYWMKRGRELEESAARAFWDKHGSEAWKMQRIGFVTTDDGRVGASPDRLIVRDGYKREGLEIKCPSPWVQIDYLLNGPGENFQPQVQGELFIAELDCVHLWCWHPQMPPAYVYTLRDDPFIERLAEALDKFCDELDADTERAKALGTYEMAKVLRLGSEMVEEIPGVFPWRQ